MELDMWIVTLIVFCVMLIENVTTLIQMIANDSSSFFIHLVAMFVSISMICTSIIQICILL